MPSSSDIFPSVYLVLASSSLDGDPKQGIEELRQGQGSEMARV